jgi:hypothetical protein
LAETVTVYFVVIFIAFWGLLSLAQTIGGKRYLQRYKRLHGRAPRREDLPRWVWWIIIPVGMRSRGFKGPPLEQDGQDDQDQGDAQRGRDKGQRANPGAS